MKKICFLLLLVVFSLCKNKNCELLEFAVCNIEFSKERWCETNIDQIDIFLTNPDSSHFFFDVLENREKMLCDLVAHELHDKPKYMEIKSLLGKGCIVRDDWESFRLLFLSMEDQSIVLLAKTNKILSYKVGQNASGICYLVLVFSDNDEMQYLGCFRALAQ